MGFHQQKISKKEKPESTHYTIHDYGYHLIDIKDKIAKDWSRLDFYQVVSIDPAIDNYGFRIEKRWSNGIIEPLVFIKKKFKVDTNNSGNSTLYKQLNDFLETYSMYYIDCHFIIIERQFNYQSTRMTQQTISYFMNICPHLKFLPYIIELDSKVKSDSLNAPKGMNRTAMKKWDVETSYQLLYARNDKYSINILDSIGAKKDDLADTVVQIEAFFALMGLPITKNLEQKGSAYTKQWEKHISQWQTPAIQSPQYNSSYNTNNETYYNTNNNYNVPMNNYPQYFTVKPSVTANVPGVPYFPEFKFDD